MEVKLEKSEPNIQMSSVSPNIYIPDGLFTARAAKVSAMQAAFPGFPTAKIVNKFGNQINNKLVDGWM